MTATPTTAPNSLKFIDISSNNFGGGKTIDFNELWAAGYRWLFVKRTEGVGYTWAEGAAIIDAWHARGGHVGHYHWLRPESDPAAQAEYFLGVVRAARGQIKPGDKVMADDERSYNYSTGQPVPDGNDAALAARVATFNTRVATALPHIELLVYTGNWYAEGHPRTIAAIKKHRVVLSEYTGADAPNNRLGFTIAAYQFTDRARVPGVNHPVDCNVWLGPITVGPKHHRQPKPSPKPAPKPIKRAKRRLYEVKEGDTLGRIADRFGLKLDELYRLNRFRHPFLRRHEYDLHIGWKIRVR
jgi:GH25 family lysozyme M1 (1,4-beta-N-acetylmuramidase)